MMAGNTVRAIGVALACSGVLVSGCREPESRVAMELEEAGYGTDPEDFHRAAEIGDLAVMERMLDEGMELEVPTGIGHTALHAAAAAGSVSAMHFLMERGLAADVRGAANRTPLMVAAEANEEEACVVLLKRGAKPELTDNSGYRAITIAADRGNVSAIRALAVYSRDYLDDALLLASLRGHGEAAGVLAEFGASVYARMDDGLTPLMLAAREGHAETVRVLMEQGANRFAVDFDGRTAGQLAAEANHDAVAELLNRDPGADAFSLVEFSEMEATEERTGIPGDEAFDDPEAKPGGGVTATVVEAIIGSTGGGAGGGVAVPVTGDGDGDGGPVGAGQDLGRAGEPVAGGAERERGDTEHGGQGPGGAGGVAVMEGWPGNAGDREDWEKEMLSGEGEVRLEPPGREDVAGGQEPRSIEESLVMESYRDKPLPLRVEGVHGDEVRVRYLYGENPIVTVEEGDEIPFTGLRVVRVVQRHQQTKMSPGKPLDVSTVVIEDPVTGLRRELVTRSGASAYEPFAVLRPRAGGEPMVARRGGVLRVPGGAMYVVQDVRPSQVVLENAATGEVHTVKSGSVHQ